MSLPLLLWLGLAGACYAAATVLHLPLWLAAIGAALAVPGAALACARVVPAAVAAAPLPRWLARTLWAALGAAALLFCLFFLEHSRRWPEGGWDAWAIWNARARFLLRGGYEASISPFATHPDYPFLVPALVASGWTLAGSETFAVPALVAFAFAALSASLLYEAASALRGRAAGAMAAALLLSTPAFFTFSWNQYSDAPLGAFLLAAAACAATGLERGTRPWLLAGVFLSLCAWCKNEGSLLALAFVFALLIAAGPRRALLCAIGAAPLFALLAVYKLHLPAGNDLVQATAHEGAHALAKLFDPHRQALILEHAVRTVLSFKDWAVFLWAVPPALVLAVRARPHPASVRALSLLLLCAGAGYWLVYLLTPHDLRWHLSSSADRLLVQLYPTALLVAALALVEDPSRAALPTRRAPAAAVESPRLPR